LFPEWDGYDKHISPVPNDGGPTKVTVNMYVRELGPVDLQMNSFRLQVTLRQEYHDSRLNFDDEDVEFISLLGDEVNKIWQPDTFFINERETIFHNGLEPNIYARIFANNQTEEARILISERITMELSCPHLFESYKGSGSITCSTNLASYGLHDKYIVYNWKSDNPIQIGNDADSFLNSENASLKYSGFTDDQMSSGTITTSTGDYSYLKLDFKFTK
jgi:hypothetical protein